MCSETTLQQAKYADELLLRTEKDAVLWKALGIMDQGLVLALTGKASDAVQTITSGSTH